MLKRSLYLVLVAALMFMAVGIQAQDATTAGEPGEIVYSTPAEGSIDNVNFTQQWTLMTASADRISVLVERVDGNLIPTVSLLDTNNQVVRDSYGAQQDGATAVIDSFALPAAGTYLVQVGRESGESGPTTGKYRLTVLPQATGEDNLNNTTVVGPITIDAPVEGEISATHWYHRYTYDALAGDSIQLTAERTSGTLAPEIQVMDANGALITTGYTDYSGDIATTNVTNLPSKGTYTIVVTRASGFNGDSVGGYKMTLKLIGAGEGSPYLAQSAGTIEYDKPLQGTITGAQWYQDWTLTTPAADTITITVERASGNLIPEVGLLGAAKQQLSYGYADSRGEKVGARAEIERYRLAGPGTYTVRVTRAGGQSRYTAGGYTLTVKLSGAGEGSPALTTPVGTITVGEPVTGEITDAVWANVWMFENPQDQPLKVTMRRTSGTLFTVFEVQDTNGQALASPYYEATRDVATYQFYNPLPAGTYRIVAKRYGDKDGYTTGGYTLVVQPPEQ